MKLEDRLGEALDRLANDPPIGEPPPFQTTRQPTSAAGSSRRWLLVPAAAVLLLTFGVGALLAISNRSPQPGSPQTANDAADRPDGGDVAVENAIAANSLPVVLDEHLVPWYVLDPATVAAFAPDADGSPSPTSSGAASTACVDWTIEAEVVRCHEVGRFGFRRDQQFVDDEGRWVAITSMPLSGAPDGYALEDYLNDWRQLADAPFLGHPEVASSQSTAELADGTAALVAVTDDGDPLAVRRAVLAPDARTLVAVETRGLSAEELLDFASSVIPAAADDQAIPIELARQPGQPTDLPRTGDRVLGGFTADGGTCVFPLDHLLTDTDDECLRSESATYLELAAAPPGRPTLYAGLVPADAPTFQVTGPDDTSTTVVRPPDADSRPWAFTLDLPTDFVEPSS